VDDEAGSEDILVHLEVRRRVLDAVQMRIFGGGVGDDVQPECVGLLAVSLSEYFIQSGDDR